MDSKFPPHDAEVQLLAEYCVRNLPLDHIELDEAYGYQYLPLCVIDAVFSIGVNYVSTSNTVKRFCSYFQINRTAAENSGVGEFSIADFVQLYSENSIEFMAGEVYRNRQRTSTQNGILKAEAALRVARTLQAHNVNLKQDFDRVMGDPAFEAAYRQIPGQRSGVSLQYLYMLAGSEDHIKPDRMIIRFITNAIGRSAKVDECHQLLLATCRLLKPSYPDLNPRKLDYAIWQYQRGQSS